MPTVDPVFHPLPTEATTPATPAGPAKSNTADKDMFLKLMIAQLKNQDPSSPVDAKDFLVQMVQFTVVEKLEAMAKSNNELLAATRLGSASSLVGRTVTYTKPGVDADAAPVEVNGTLSGVRVTPDGLILKVGTTDIALDAVIAVGGPAANATPANSGTTAEAATAATTGTTGTTGTTTTGTTGTTATVATAGQ